MKYTELITLITAIIGCICGVISIIINIKVSFAKPKYKICVSNLNLQPLKEDTIPSKFSESDVSYTKLQMMKKAYTHFMQLEISILNDSSSVQLLENIRYTYISENGPMLSSYPELISNINSSNLPIFMNPQSATKVTINFIFTEKIYNVLQNNLKHNKDLGKLAFFTYNDIIEKDLLKIYNNSHRITIIPTKLKIKYNRRKYKKERTR